MKNVVIIQARLTSTRLPAKVLKKINGKSIIEIINLRLKRSQQIDKIVFAIPNNSKNSKLKQHLDKLKIDYYEGDEFDVLGRYYYAAKKYKADNIIRITADCPLIDPNIVDEVIKLHIKNKSHFTSNVNPPTFPDGLDVQVSTFKTLEKIWKIAKKPYHREHVFTYLEENQFVKINNYFSKKDFSHIRITLDEKKDLRVIEEIFKFFKPNIYFNYFDLVKLMNNNKRLFLLNSKFKRNYGKDLTNTEKLWNKAKNLIPGGNSLLSKNPEIFLNNGWPTYFTKANKFFVWDIDGNKYQDMVMSPGTNVLGYSNSKIDNKIKLAINHSNMSTLNSVEEVELAEKLIEIHPWANMVKFAKTGGEANAIAIRIARAYQKNRTKVAFCGYHGWHDWYVAANIKSKKSLDDHLLEGLPVEGVPKELVNTVFPFKYNDIKGFENLIKKNQDIGIVKMEIVRNLEINIKFLKEIKKICKKNKIILIFDECTSGFRLNYGGMHKIYNINPDIVVFGKALSNGYPLTAVLGKKKIMKSALSTFISSTFWTDRIGFVAALETLKYIKENKTYNIVKENGRYIKEKWSNLAKKNNLDILIEGTDAIPNFSFPKDIKGIYKSLIASEMLKDKILASNIIFVSIHHNKKNLKKYFYKLDKIFNIINLIENKKIKINLNSFKLKRSFFKRLN